jgi:hypothetical protein
MTIIFNNDLSVFFSVLSAQTKEEPLPGPVQAGLEFVVLVSFVFKLI